MAARQTTNPVAARDQPTHDGAAEEAAAQSAQQAPIP